MEKKESIKRFKRYAKRFLSAQEVNSFLLKEEQTQYQNEREHANALMKESLDSCSSRVQKERIKDAID